MAAEKDAELIEVTHSVSIPIIRAQQTRRQVYKDRIRSLGSHKPNEGGRLQLFFPINDNYNSRSSLDPIQRQRQLLFPIGWPTDLARKIRRAVRFSRRVKRRRALRGRNPPRDNPADGVPPGTRLRGSNHPRGVFFAPGGHQSHALKIHLDPARSQHPFTSACLPRRHPPVRRAPLASPSAPAPLGSSGCSTPRSRCDAPDDRSRRPSSSGP